MKALFIFPPIWSCFSPSFGIPSIMGYLKVHGYETEVLDLNIDFYNYAYQKSYGVKHLEHIKKYYEVLKNKDFKNINNSLEAKFEQSCLKKLEKSFEPKNIVKIKRIINSADFMRKVFKDFRKFFIPTFYMQALNVFTLVGKFIFLTLPNEIESMEYDYETFSYLANQREMNIFIPYFETKLNEILSKNYDYIGFSANSSCQTLLSFTFANMLKKNGYKGFIGLGGSDALRMEKYVFNSPDLFKNFFNGISLGQGETGTLELFEYLEGKRKMEDVSGFIYLNSEGQVQKNEGKYLAVSEMAPSSFDGYKFDSYFLPEAIVPIRASHGCYWGKCTFCDYNYDNNYYCRNIDSVVEEVKYITKNYKVNNFYFVDACLSPNFLENFAKRIIEEKIKIAYCTNTRFEKEFNRKNLKLLRKSGLMVCAWGLESASEKILGKMNKGTSPKEANRILKEAYEAGIINHIYMITDFLGESDEDYDKTLNFIKKNRKYIISLANHYFILNKNSYIFEHPLEFGLSEELINKLTTKEPDRYSFYLHDLGYEINKEKLKKLQEVEKLLGGNHLKGCFEVYILMNKIYGIRKYKFAYLLSKVYTFFYKFIKKHFKKKR